MPQNGEPNLTTVASQSKPLPLLPANNMKKAKRSCSSGAFAPLRDVTSPTVTTEAAAHYLNRRPQTLRVWSMGRVASPVIPLRINGRLAWPVSDLKRLLEV